MPGNDVIQVIGRGSSVDFTIDDSAPFERVIQGVQEYLQENRTLYSKGDVTVNVGRRLSRVGELAQIKETLEQGWGFNVTRYWCSPDVLGPTTSETDVGEWPEPSDATTAPASPRRGPGTGLISDDSEGPESARFLEAAYWAKQRADEAGGRSRTNGTRQHESQAQSAMIPSPNFVPLSSDQERANGESRLGEALLVKHTCRSGEVIQCPGDVIVMGDVNPGAEIIAYGDIVVFGALRGMAHAGAAGDHQAVVVALNLEAPRLRIGLYSGAAPESPRESKTVGTVPKIAYVRRRSIYVDRYVGRFAGYDGGTLYDG